MIRLLILFWFGFFSVFTAANGEAGLVEARSAENIEHPRKKVELARVKTLISFQDKLLVFDIKENSSGKKSRGLGIVHQGSLELSPVFDSYSQDIVHTQWRGRLVVAGRLPFSNIERTIGRILRPRLAIFDGQTWQEIGGGFQGRVSAMTVWRGDLIVAGALSIEEAPELSSLARWDGSLWQEVPGQPRGGGESRITCLTVHEDQLVVGGIFSEMGGSKVRNLATFDGEVWSPLGGGPNAMVSTVVSFQGDLFAHGKFTCIGGNGISGLARWDGVQWNSLAVTTGEIPQRGRFWELKMLPTINGLFMAGNMESFTGVQDQVLACWNEKAWSPSIPTVHNWKRFLKGPELRTSKSRLVPGRQLSQPRPWPSEPCFKEEIVLERSWIKDLAWHQNELVIYTTGDSGCWESDTNPRLLALAGNSWRSLLPPPDPENKFIASYGKGTLHLLEDAGNGQKLVWRKGARLDTLGSWLPRRLIVEEPSFHVQGDTIIVVGQLDGFAGMQWHHCALFDGTRWQSMGDGLPFDEVRNAKLHSTKFGLYLTADFYNLGHVRNSGLMKWTGDQWTAVEFDSGAYNDQMVQSDGVWLYRANTENPVTRRFMSPTHQSQDFPSSSRPYIQRWTGKNWEMDWQGETGRIIQFAHDGQALWAALAGGRDANILKLENEQWVTVSSGPIAGADLTKINPIIELLVFQGKPVIVVQPGEPSQYSKRLASFQNGRWFWLGPDFFSSDKLKVESGQLELESDFLVKPPYGKKKGIWRWDGTSVLDEPVPIVDLEELDRWEAVCRASDQRDRPELDLPWPRGLKTIKNALEINSCRRPGWHLSAWPDSVPPHEVIGRRGKNTMILKPNSWEDLQFFFWWDKNQPGLLELEFRLLNSAHWDWAAMGEDELAGPALYDGGALGKVPSLRIQINNIDKTLPLWADDGQWHKVSIPFGKNFESQTQKLIFRGGRAATDSSQIEIRNLRIRRKKSEDHRQLVKEVTRILRDYSCPDIPQGRVKDFCEELEGLAEKRDGWNPVSHLRYLFSPAGLSGEFLAQEERGAGSGLDGGMVLRSVVDNLDFGEVSSGWVPGGGLYLRSGVLPGFMKPDGFLRKLHDDSDQMKSINGLILDMRDSSNAPYCSADTCFYRASEVWSFFASDAHTWGQIQADAPDGPLVGLTIQPAGNPWTEVPVVALVSDNTPGHVVLMLNALPNITTVGRPSAPVMVPTRPHLLDNSRWAYFPAGRVFDGTGKNVSLCRISPDIEVPLNASYDTAIREAMQVLGFRSDPESNFCPLEMVPQGR